MIELKSGEIRRRLKTCLLVVFMGLIGSACPQKEDGEKRYIRREYQITVPEKLFLRLGDKTLNIEGSVKLTKGEEVPGREFEWRSKAYSNLISVSRPSMGKSFSFQVTPISPDSQDAEKRLRREIWRLDFGTRYTSIQIFPTNRRSDETVSGGKIDVRIRVSPDDLEDFGVIDPRETPDIDVQLERSSNPETPTRFMILNHGGAPLEIRNISFSTQEFSVKDPPDYSFLIERGQFESLALITPSSGPAMAEMWIDSNDPRTPRFTMTLTVN